MVDKRRCLRHKIEVPAWFKNTRYQKDLSLATTINISATGICLTTREPLEAGQEVLMQVKLPPDERVIINTRVVWIQEIMGLTVREYLVGLRLVEPMQFEEKKFVQFCARKMLDFYNQEQGSA
jgi:Tfp pilus assembly protein PilZ